MFVLPSEVSIDALTNDLSPTATTDKSSKPMLIMGRNTVQAVTLRFLTTTGKPAATQDLHARLPPRTTFFHNLRRRRRASNGTDTKNKRRVHRRTTVFGSSDIRALWPAWHRRRSSAWSTCSDIQVVIGSGQSHQRYTWSASRSSAGSNPSPRISRSQMARTRCRCCGSVGMITTSESQ